MSDVLKTEGQRFDLKPSPKVTMDEVIEMGAKALGGLRKLKESLLIPKPAKIAPSFSIKEMCELLGVDRNQLRSAQKKLNMLFDADLGKSKTTFSLIDFFSLGESLQLFKTKPEGKKAFVLVIASYKGGVSKTTTAINLAHGLSLKGLGKGLVIDLDGQSSASTLMGLSPEFEEDTMTVMDYIFGDVPSLRDCIQESYWHNLDIISGSSAIHGAETFFAGQLRKNAQTNVPYEYWNVLSVGLEELRDEYSFIVIDTSPSLGFLTQNAMLAADGLISPLPNQALDVASMAQFWDVFADNVKYFPAMMDKNYEFVEILMSKTPPESSDIGTEVKKWIKHSYGAHVSDISIPDSVIASKVAAVYSTVFEISEKDLPKESYRRYKEPVKAYVDHIHQQILKAWSRHD